MPLPVQRSPTNTNQSHKEPSLTEILAAIHNTRSDMNMKLDLLAHRIEVMECTTNRLKNAIDEFGLKHVEMEAKIAENTESCDELRGEISALKETTDRMWRKNNLVVFGIPENEESENLINDFMGIILPACSTARFERIGKENEKIDRPVRIHLSTFLDKKSALSNCQKLKGMDKFKKISVRPDLTKEQINQRKTPVRTRSQAHSSESTKHKSNKVTEPPKKKSKYAEPMTIDA